MMLLDRLADRLLELLEEVKPSDLKRPEILAGPARQTYIDQVWGNSFAGKLITIAPQTSVVLNPGTYQWSGGYTTGVLQFRAEGSSILYQVGTASTFALQSPQTFFNAATVLQETIQLLYFPDPSGIGVPLFRSIAVNAATYSARISFAGDWVFIQTRGAGYTFVRSISGSGAAQFIVDSVAGDTVTIGQTAIL